MSAITIGALRTPLRLFMELLWSYAATALAVHLFGGGGRGPSFLSVSAVVVGSFALARALAQLDVSEGAMRTIGAATSVVALFAVAHIEYGTAPWDAGWLRALVIDGSVSREVAAGALAMLVIWMRGVIAGSETQDFDGVLRSALIGLPIVALAALTLPQTRGPDAFGVLALLYIVVALFVLALFQAPDEHQALRRAGGSGVPVLLFVAVSAVVLALIAAAIDPPSFGPVAPAAKPLLIAAKVVLQYVVGPVIGAIVWLIEAILPPLGHAPPRPAVPDSPLAKHQPEKDTPLAVQIFGYVLAGMFVTVVLLAIFGLLWFAFRRFSRRPPHTMVRREQLEAASLLGEDLAALLAGIRRRFPRRQGSRSAVAIRKLYQELLDDAADRGIERAPPVTPHELAPVLDGAFDSALPSAITSAFMASRYGGKDVDAKVVQYLRQEWRQIRSTAR